MAKIKTMCHICMETIKSEAAPDICPKCGANLADRGEEKTIKYANCQYSSKNWAVGPGTLYLTNLRLLWVNNTSAYSAAGGLVGALVASLQKWGFSLPLSEIKSFEDSKFGLFIKAFTITANDGTTMKLSAKPREEWIEAIKKAKAKLG